MANIQILRSSIDDAEVSGGDWLGGLPAENLLNQQPKRIARSVDLEPASTFVVFDLGEPRMLSMFALIATNLSVGSTWRIQVSASAEFGTTLLDVTLEGRPSDVVWGSLPWGALPWNGLLGKNLPGGATTFYKHPVSVLGRYLRIDIDDPANPAGYVQIGRAMAGEAFSPQINMSFGVELGIVDETRKSRTIGGQVYSDRKPARRRFSCAFDAITEAEAMGQIYDLMLEVGVSGSVLVVYDPDDSVAVLPRRTLYAQLSDLAPIVTANPSTHPHTWRLQAEELI